MPSPPWPRNGGTSFSSLALATGPAGKTTEDSPMDPMTYAHKLARAMGQRWRASTPFHYQQAFRVCLRIANKRLRPT